MNNAKQYASVFDGEADYIGYVNSRDIREYLYAVDYRLTDLQAFCLVDSCTHISYAQKLKALNRLLDECTDISINIMVFREIKSLKALIRYTILGRRKALADFENSGTERR